MISHPTAKELTPCRVWILGKLLWISPLPIASIKASIMAKVETRLASSHGELDARISTLDCKVGQVAQKVDSQEGLLQSLFAQQLSRVEELIGTTKKPRAE